MFLNKLSDRQKELFLDVCIHAANADNHFADEEKAIIEQYCAEMQIEPPRFKTDARLDEILDELFKISDETEIKIIAFELLGLLLSDKKYNEFERTFMDDFLALSGITEEDYDGMLKNLDELTKIYDNINKLIFIG